MGSQAFQNFHPAEAEQRDRDKLHFRMDMGESYEDVIHRLQPIIIELERQRQSVVVVANLVILRCIFAYFTGIPISNMPYIQVPIHNVVEMKLGVSGTKEVKQIPLTEAFYHQSP